MSLVDIVINIFEVLPKDIANMNQDTLIQAPLITGFFYFISRWFRAYVLRLGLFLFGSLIVFQVFQGQSFLNRFDFYAGLGILLPHIPIVELTYLILRERTLFMYGKILELFFLIASPFVWLFNVSRSVLGFFKAKQEEKNHQQEKKQYEQKSREYRQEQNSKQQRQKQYQEQTKQEPPKQEEKKTYSRWDSLDPYEVLGIDREATRKEMKKAYRNLSKIYHPDLTLTNKEEHQVIFVKINNAYDMLK